MAANSKMPAALQPLTTDSSDFPHWNPNLPIQGHWLLDHSISESLKPHLQELVCVAEVSCVIYP